MSGLPPGDPQLVAMIVNHLKTQGLFDQFRRDCLADVDTKPAYLHLRQRVDNFVSNHLSNHTWSPQLNKNQLRNNIRQLVLQSGMLEQGVDRIVAQVVDPKIHHTFRPQVERIVRQFLSPGSHTEEEEPPVAHSLLVENQDTKLLSPVLSSVTAPAVGADPADSTSSQSQEEAGAEPPQDGPAPNEEEGEAAMGLVQDVPREQEEREEERGEGDAGKPADDGDTTCVLEDRESEMEVEREVEPARIEEEEEEQEAQKGSGVAGRSGEEEEEEQEQKGPGEKQHIRQRARERLKEEYSLEDSDLEGLSDITVSSVHTSDLSSFEGESEGEQAPSDTTEEGEITSEDDRVLRKSASEEENKEKKPRGARQGYVHKPFLYSRYYSDSDDEVTVEQRRRSAAKEKEERVLKRQQNRERLEEKRRQKAAQSDLQEKEKHVTATSNQEAPRPQAKEARKEKKVLEKKVALSRKRKRDSRREDDSGSRKKSDADVDVVKKEEALKFKAAPPKPSRKLSEAEDPRRRKSASVSEDDPCESRTTLDKNRTHSFILDLEMGSEEVSRQRGAGRSERHAPRREALPRDREHGGSEERLKRRPKTDDRDAPADRTEKKGSKVKGERKSWAAVREGRLSMSEGLEEGAIKAGKKSKSVSETPREKTKGEKSGRAETNPLHQLDSTASTEERSEVDATSELNKKKDKHTKDVLKKSKSHLEVRTSEKVKGRQESERERARAELSTTESPRNLPETGSKVKPVGDKPRSKIRDDVKPQSPPGSRADKESKVTKVVKVRTGAAPGRAELCRERKREDRTAEKTKEVKTVRKTSEKRIKDVEKKVCEGEERNSPTEEPSDSHAPSDLKDQMPPQPSDAQTASNLPDEMPPQPSDAQMASDLPDEMPPQPSDAQTQSDLTDETPPQPSHAQERSDLTAGQTSASLEESDLAGSSWSNFKEPQMGDSPTHSATITPQALDNKSDLADVQALAEPEFTGTISNQPADSCLGSVLVGMETAPESCPMAGLGHGVADDTTVPDDMYDALSDITPEPEDEGEAAMRLSESQEQSRPLPVEADALLTLVDVCASAAGNEVGGMPDGQEAERSFHEADMKMQEAALALLSMDAHVSMAQSLITEPCHLVDTTLAIEETPVARQQVQPQHPDLGDVPEEVAKESESDTVSGVQPDLEGGASEDGDQQPNMGGEASKDGDQQPNMGGEASKDGYQQPDVGDGASDDGNQQSELGGGVSEYGDQQQDAPALINNDMDVMATERASTEEVMSQGACDVQANSFEAVCLSQSEAPDLSANDDPTLAPGGTSADTEPSPTWTHSPSPDHMTAHTQAAETQPETHAQEYQSKDAPREPPPGADAPREPPPGADAPREPPPGADAPREPPPGADASHAGPRGAGEDRGVTELDTVTVRETQSQPARRGRPPKLTKQTSSTSRSDGREEDRSDASEVEDRVESRTARKGRPASQKAAADKHSGSAEQETIEPDNTAPKKDEDVEEGRSTVLPDTPQHDAWSQLQQVEATGEDVELKEMRRGRRRSGVHPSSTAKLSLKRKRSDQAEDSGKELPAEEESMKRARHDSDAAEDVGEEKCEEARGEEGESERESSKDSKEETEEEEKDEPVRKTPRRGRPSKSTSGTEDAASSEKREGEEPGEDEEETKTRATTRAASRLEAEKNKPYKPSTRAFSRLSVKEESSPITRASRAQVSGAMKGRKCEVSPPAPRTRAGHKAEEPAAKRTKR